MTDQEINIAIAEACGWRKFREEEYPHRIMWREGEPGSAVWDDPPDYCHDLNAMREAEVQVLPTLNQKVAFVDSLRVVIDMEAQHFVVEVAALVCATARQRAEAFLRTLNKWTA